MPSFSIVRLILIATLLLLSHMDLTFGQAKRYAELRGRVASVYDGDTFTLNLDISSQMFFRNYLMGEELRTGHVNIRLAGIDAPELIPEEFGARESKRFLDSNIRGHNIRVMVAVTKNGRLDRSGNRLVGHAYRGDFHISLEMLRAGFARDDWRFSLGLPAIASQWDAMNRRKGVWSNPVQWKAENQFRIRLYGGGNNLNIVIAPKPFAMNQPRLAPANPLFKNPGVGRVNWQMGFKNQLPQIPQFRNN